MTLYGTKEQVKEFPGIYKKFPEEEYRIEIAKKIQEIENRKLLEKRLKDTN